MPGVLFQPNNLRFEVEPNTKLLACATRNKISLRYGCAACKCGTCGIRASGDAELSPMLAPEKDLLKRMALPLDGTVRLACQARILSGEVQVDLSFQLEYSPDEGEENEEDSEEQAGA